ncbi:MAG: ATP-binding protein [Pseudomonadota bacterium]
MGVLRLLGIRFKLFTTFAVILFVAMFLMSMVMLYMSQRFLIQSELERGKTISRMLVRSIDIHGKEAGGRLPKEFSGRVDQLIQDQELLAGCIWDPYLNKDHLFGNTAGLKKKVTDSAHRLIKTGKEEILFCDSSWNLFLKNPTVAIKSLTIKQDDGTIGAAAFAIPLTDAFRNIRIIQEFLLLYLFINTLLFSVIGVSRVSRFFLRPIRKLIQRATEFRHGDGFSLPYEGEGSEWDTLSRAVNRIVELNLKDNQKLSETVASLQQAMEDLKKAQQEMIRAEKLATVGRLSSGIAHEIGNPIGIMLGYLELIQQPSFPEIEKGDIIRHIEVQARRIDQIIRQLLDFSRPGKTTITMTSTHGVVKEILDMLHLHPLFSAIEMSESLSAELDIVRADHSQLHQAFLNLILNAADAIEETHCHGGGRIRISSENISADENLFFKKPAIKLSVIDNGEGIRPEHIEEIFDPFFTTKAPGKGTGLGLWVSFMIIEGIGGKIQVNSSVGEGTRMSVYLPVVSEK